MRELLIREPAGSLLVRTKPVLDRYLTPHTPGGEGWRLGGGTVLASHWKHRESIDLDIQLHPGTERHHLSRKVNPELWARMYQAGATHIDMEANPRFEFGTGHRIELLETRPIPRLGHEEVVTQAGVVTVLSTAQVLCGKMLKRIGATPTRDLYDFAVAGHVDHEALAIAVNACPRQALEAARAEWTARREEYARDARDALRGVPPEYQALANDPARAAREAVNAARYVHLRIHAGKGKVVAEATTERSAIQHVWETVQELREGAERSGVNWTMEATGRSPGRIRNRAWNAAQGTELNEIITIEDSTTS